MPVVSFLKSGITALLSARLSRPVHHKKASGGNPNRTPVTVGRALTKSVDLDSTIIPLASAPSGAGRGHLHPGPSPVFFCDCRQVSLYDFDAYTALDGDE